jgi:putative FmdB family regulatory protein
MALFAAVFAAGRVRLPQYHGLVPIYEFSCAACGERFEALVPPGTASTACPACGETDSERVMSLPAQPMRLAKSPRERRRLEDARGTSRDGANRRFKEARRAAKARAVRRDGGSR